MHETQQDLERLQGLLDQSHARAGSHLRSIFSEERRASAAEIADRMTGVRIISLATVTSGGEPRVGPVDGLFYRGRFHFGTSEEAVRIRNIRRNPAVSAAYTEGEQFAVIVHGNAVELDRTDPGNEGFWEYCREVYPDWDQWASESPYAVVVADRAFSFVHDPDG